MKGTDPPISFSQEHVRMISSTQQGAVAWGAAGRGMGLGAGMRLGAVSVGRLMWAKRGPVVAHSVEDGFLKVGVDRHTSLVGNPFTGAPIERLCRAYDDLLHTMLLIDLQVDEGLHHYQGLQDGLDPSAGLLEPYELALLQDVARRHTVKIHVALVRPCLVRAWLCHHALLLVQGQSLLLLCWCLKSKLESAVPWSCHAQSLAGALYWFVETHLEQLEMVLHARAMDVDLAQVHLPHPPFIA